MKSSVTICHFRKPILPMKTIDLLFEESGLSLQELAQGAQLAESRLLDILNVTV